MSFLSVAVMFCLNIFKKLTKIKEAKSLAPSICAIIFVISMLIDNVFTLEQIANTFYKYGSLILIFGIFTIVLIRCKHKKAIFKKFQ